MTGPPTTERPAAGEVDTLLTVPNLFTLLRLLCLPLFLYLLLGRENRAAAGWLLFVLGCTDWVDGYLARRLGQVSEFGRKFDPTVDRLLFIVALLAIIYDDAAPRGSASPSSLASSSSASTIAIATVFFSMARFDVTFLGKLATFLLLGAIPAFVIGSSDFPAHVAFNVLGWLVGIPGLVLSWYTAIRYIPQIRQGVAVGRAARAAR